jgi:hypothetical protein
MSVGVMEEPVDEEIVFFPLYFFFKICWGGARHWRALAVVLEGADWGGF